MRGSEMKKETEREKERNEKGRDTRLRTPLMKN